MKTLKHNSVNTPLRGNRKQKGVGLIEVLVALVVVSFGVLGMASLQLTGMKHSSGGFNRAKALLYAKDMATRMRINDDKAQAYAPFNSTSVNCSSVPAPYCQTTKRKDAQECTTDEFVAFDTFSVSCGDYGVNAADSGVTGSLPNGELSVICIDTSCTAFEVTVSWTEGRSRTDADELDTRRVQVRLRP